MEYFDEIDFIVAGVSRPACVCMDTHRLDRAGGECVRKTKCGCMHHNGTSVRVGTLVLSFLGALSKRARCVFTCFAGKQLSIM